MSNHANLKPVDPATEASILDLFSERWTLTEPPAQAQAQGEHVPPYRGHKAPEPYQGPGRRPKQAKVTRHVTIEEVDAAAAKARTVATLLGHLLKNCKRAGISDFEVHGRKPMGGLHRAHDFALEANGIVSQLDTNSAKGAK